jgi:hypothetical protein
MSAVKSKVVLHTGVCVRVCMHVLVQLCSIAIVLYFRM